MKHKVDLPSPARGIEKAGQNQHEQYSLPYANHGPIEPRFRVVRIVPIRNLNRA